MKNRYHCSAQILAIVTGAALLIPGVAAWAQSNLFEIRFEPASVSALESSGGAQIDVIVALVNAAPIANDISFQFDSDFGAPVCVFTAPAPGVLVNDTDPDGDPLTAFGVNLPAGLTLNPDGSFVFSSPFGCSGAESFTYVASDGTFSSNPATVDLTLNTAPVANPGGAYTPTRTFPFTLNGAGSSDLDGTIVAWDWDFGDMNQGTGEMPTHTYTVVAGLYTITLTVTDNLGAQDTQTTTANVLDPIPIISATTSQFGARPPSRGAPTVNRRPGRITQNGVSSYRSTAQHASILSNRAPTSLGSSLRGTSAGVGGGLRIFTANYSATSGTATAGSDFIEIPNGVLQWTLQDTFPLRLSFTVTILNDDIVEEDKTVQLALSSPDAQVTVLTSSGVLTIIDDDSLGTVQFRQSSFRVSEGEGSATILVDLTGSQSGPSSVQYAATPGTAEAGEDFEPTSGTLTWEQGFQGTKTFAVEIFDNNLLEDDKTVSLTLSNPVGIELGARSTANLVILDNDQPTGVVIERGDEQAGKVGADLDEPLVVRVSNAQGEPVAGATVSWQILEGEGEFLDGTETITDSEGLSSNRLRLGTDLGDVKVSASVPSVEESATFSLTAELRLTDLSLGNTERPVAEVLDDICNGTNLGGMQSTCDDLAKLPDDDQKQAMNELSPRKVAAQGDTAITMMLTQSDIMRDRMRGLRRDQRRGLSNLALQLHDITMPVDALADSLSFEQPQEYDVASADVTAPPRGGGASADDPGEETDEESWLGNRLGLFLSGVLAVGDRPSVEDEVGFELETTGLTFGLDYKLSDKFVWGGALGYMSTDGDLKGSGGTLDAKGISLSTYVLLMPTEQWFFEAIGSYGDIDFDTERTIDFPGNLQVARANPQGNQSFLALGGGYDAQRGASTFSLVARGSYLDIDIDPYREKDAPGMQLSIAGQTIKSMVASAGFEYFYTGSMSWGILTPGLRLLYNHEFEDDLRFITASFVDDPQALSFAIPTTDPDRDYLRAGLSLTATLPRGISAYATYDSDLSRNDLSLYVITAGFRLELK